MAGRKSKSSEDERLDDASMDRAIQILANKGTKKEACSILNITYNTTRLASLIEKYKDRKATEAKKRAEKRGTSATKDEIRYAIQCYLEGDTVDSISKTLFRNPTFIANILITYNVPIRNIPHNYFRPKLIPEEATRDAFKIGEKVYSARYDSLAIIKGEFKPKVYRIYLLSDKWQQFAYQPAEELASLEHLKELGIDL